jgi:DNA-binding SARP family transcriptional activator/tetratricopeptide (TPR) repeat protein
MDNSVELPGHLNRPRLLKKLHAAQNRRLILISAPPGFGKTVLAHQFVQTQAAHLWYTLDETDRDLTALIVNLNRAFSQQDVNWNAPRVGSYSSPAELASQLIEALKTQCAQDFYLVLDDAHLLVGAAQAEQWLRSVVTHIPARCHLILISRVLPNLPFTDLIAHNDVLILHQGDLKFTVDEIQNLAAQPIDSATLAMLTDRLDGWPTGIVLALQQTLEGLTAPLLAPEPNPEMLFNALAENMLHSQSSELRDFLLVSSTLHAVTPERCSAIWGLASSAPMLQEIQRRHLFVERQTAGIVYHPLFRQFLQQHLFQEAPARFMDLHREAGQWFEKQQDLENAISHYLTAQDVERAVPLIEHLVTAYFAQGKFETLLTWKKLLQSQALSAPQLFCRCGIIYTDRYEYDLARIAFRQAELGFQAQGDSIGCANIQLQRAWLAFQSGDFQHAIELAEPLLKIEDRQTNLRGRALNTLALSHMRLGDLRTALTQLQQALPLYRAHGDAYALSQVLQNLGVVYARQGRLQEASACLQEVVALRRELGAIGALALALNNLGYYYHRHQDYTQAYTTFQEGLNLVSHLVDPRTEAILLWNLGDLQRDRHAWDEADALYTRALGNVGPQEPVLRCAILISHATLRRWEDRPAEALLVAQEAAHLAAQHQIAREGLLAELGVWAAEIQSRHWNGDLVPITRITTALRQQEAHADVVKALLVEARAYGLLGDSRSARNALTEALRIAEATRNLQYLASDFLYQPGLEAYLPTSSALQKVLQTALQQLKDHQILTPAQNVEMGAELPFQLKVLTLGNSQVWRDGEIIPAAAWRSSNALELFLYLLFHGPQTREQISLAFWPDSSSKRVRGNFHTTLYRTRQPLGEQVILFEEDRYFLNPGIEIVCDALNFEHYVRQSRLLSAHDARTEDLLKQAVDLYQGEFLTAVDMEWVSAKREHLERLYMHALVRLARCATARRDFERALWRYRQALDRDPYREDLHRHVLRLYVRLGQRHQISAYVANLERKFQQDLHSRPSQKTLKLVQQLLQ